MGVHDRFRHHNYWLFFNEIIGGVRNDFTGQVLPNY